MEARPHSQPKQPLGIAEHDFGLLFLCQAQLVEGRQGLGQGKLREVRTQQQVIDTDIMHGPDELVLDGRSSHDGDGRGNVEIDIIPEEILSGARERENIPEAEIQPSAPPSQASRQGYPSPTRPVV